MIEYNITEEIVKHKEFKRKLCNKCGEEIKTWECNSTIELGSNFAFPIGVSIDLCSKCKIGILTCLKIPPTALDEEQQFFLERTLGYNRVP